jgi:hypothetical protein
MDNSEENTMNHETKKCIKCERILSISEFSRNKKMLDGHLSVCKKCSGEYRKAWAARNRDKLKKNDKKFRDSHPEYSAAYREKNREKSKAACREWYKKNKEKYNEGRRRIKTCDEEALSPMLSGGYVRWAVISTSRRIALGEKSSYNGLSMTGCDE